MLYKRGHIISIGYNTKKTHPGTLPFYKYPHQHAEFRAIQTADDEEIAGANLACVRINRAGNLLNSSPCEECRKMMKFYGVACIVYSSTNGIQKETLL